MLESILDITIDLAVAVLFGGMVFFPAVVAPLVFRVLDQEAAGRFLRALFPRYYAFMIVSAGVSGMLTVAVQPLNSGLLLGVAASTLWVRQVLVPRLNRWRDAELAGDAEAGDRFARGHRLSVTINVLQLLAVAVVIALRA